MDNELSTVALAEKNLSKKPHRTVLLVLLSAVSAAVLFACFVITGSLQNGFSSLRKRFGADLMVVPEGYEGALEGILLEGEPSYFYMDSAVVDAVSAVQGVDAVTPQFYLTSLSEECCDFPIQLIGFDPGTDFVVSPWISERFHGAIGDGTVFAGASVPLEHDSVTFFGESHAVSSRLAKSGSGMDSAIYTDLDSLSQIVDDAKSRGFGFLTDGDARTNVSSVLVRLSSGAKPDSTALRIREAFPGVKVVQSARIVGSFSASLSKLRVFLYVLSASVLIVSFLTLSLVFSVTTGERTKEFSILRILGASRAKLSSIVLCEAFLITVSGAVAGISLSALIVFPFSTAISRSVGMPLIIPGAGAALSYAVAGFLAIVVAGLLAAAGGALRISRLEPYGGAR